MAANMTTNIENENTVYISLIGNGWKEDAGSFDLGQHEYLGPTFVRFRDMMALLLRVRPEVSAVEFRYRGFSMIKQAKEAVEELNKIEKGYNDGYPTF
jgi:hypothetical protein